MSIEISEVMNMNEEKKEVESEVDDEKDIQEFREVMTTLRDFIPEMIRKIVDVLYSSQSAEDFAKQVANFYKSLVDAGMSSEQAFQLTMRFMDSRDIVGVMKEILSEGNWKQWTHGEKRKEEMEESQEEIANKIRKEVHEELKKEGKN